MSYERIDPIVVGVDGSDIAATALNWAATEAERRGCPVEAMTVMGAMDDGRRAASQVRTAAERHPSVHIRHIEAIGSPARALVNASRAAAMLVLGSRGPGLVARALLGSISTYCAAHAQCPVVIVPDPERATDFVGRSAYDTATTLGPLL